MVRLPSLKKGSPTLGLLLALALFTTATPVLRAQDGAAAQAQKGQYALNAGDYEGAILAFQDIIDNYKTSLAVPEAYSKVGYAQFLLNRPEEAEKNVRAALAAVNVGPQVKEFATNILPQIISARAAGIEDKAEKIKVYEEAIAAFDAFLTAYPQADTEAALYGKALAQYFSDKYDDAAATLTATLTQFSNTPSVADTKYLLAVTKSSQASKALLENQAANLEQALALYGEAEMLLDDIINMQGTQRNPALINDAHFQKGELYFNRGVLSKDPAAQKESFQESLTQYRAVEPKQRMIEEQQKRVQDVIDQFITAARDQRRLTMLQNLRDREQIKLAQLRAKPGQTLDARIKVARIFNQLGQYDESRVLLKFLGAGGFEMTDDQQKQVLYYLTLSYALQGKMDLALANYEEFQTTFAGDPMAENLPLVVGNLFLSATPPDPAKALEYFSKGLELYPNGELASAAKMARGQALLQLGRLDEANTAFTESLAGNPSEDIAVGAYLGQGLVKLTQQDWDGGITIYNDVIAKYPNQPAAKEAQLRVAYAMQQKGDLAAAATTLTKFLDENKEGPLVSTARYTLGEVQAAQNQPDQALATYQALATDLPDAQEAPIALLQIANIHANAGRVAEQEVALRQYLDKYPEDQNVYYAYNSLAQNKINLGQQAEAAVVWGEFASKYPQDPLTPAVLLTQAQIYRGLAQARGGYTGLPPETQTAWQEEMANAVSAAEAVVKQYPESDSVAASLALIMEIKRAQVAAEVEQMAAIGTYFEGLAEELSSTPAARSQVLFVLASYVQPQDADRALALMKEAYNPELKFNAADLDNYGLVLVESGDVDAAQALYEKIRSDYPVPEGVDPKQTDGQVQRAQAIALYGLGKVAEKRGDAVAAGQFFEELKQLYPWSSKIREADYGIAAAMRASQKFDEAIRLLSEILRDPNATFDLKARCVLLAGHIYKDKGDADAALDNYKKIYMSYPVADEPAAQGLWESAQIYKSKGMTKEHDDAIAILKSKYPNTKWATQA